MDTLKAEFTEFESLKDLKPMLAAQGPCLSAFMQLSSAPGNQGAKGERAAMERDSLKTLEPKIEQYGSEGRELLESISRLGYAFRKTLEPQGKSLAVFRVARCFPACAG